MPDSEEDLRLAILNETDPGRAASLILEATVASTNTRLKRGKRV
jgi:hypothetical protein